MRHITLGKVLARDWIIQTSSEKTLNYGSMVFLTYQQKITDAYFGGNVDLSDVVRPHRWSTPPTPPGKAAGLQMAALPFILISTTIREWRSRAMEHKAFIWRADRGGNRRVSALQKP